MAQKPYKHNIEYIQKYYSYGSEAKVIELNSAYQEGKPPAPKQEKEPVTTICIDPIAFCGLMVTVVMVFAMVAGLIQYNVIAQDHDIMENYVQHLREESVLLNLEYDAGYNPEHMDVTARALGMIPIEEAQTISIQVQVPVRESDPSFLDNVIWFLGGLFA